MANSMLAGRGMSLAPRGGSNGLMKGAKSSSLKLKDKAQAVSDAALAALSTPRAAMPKLPGKMAGLRGC